MEKFYRVKFSKVVKQTENAICLGRWCDEGIVWLPKSCIKLDTRDQKSIAYIMPEWLYKEKMLSGRPFAPLHHPKKITPVYNQEALDELKC